MNKRQAKLNALESQINRLSRYIDTYSTTSETFTRWRLGIFSGGVVAFLVGLAIHPVLAGITAILSSIAFLVLVYYHQQVKATLARFKAWRKIKTTHLARMRLAWKNIPPEVASSPTDHPYAIDLDIIGKYSVHRLLDTSVSRGGSERLRHWLLDSTPDLETITRRQTLVRELIPLSMFRDKLMLNAALVATSQTKKPKWDSENLLHWLRTDDGIPRVSQRTLLLLSTLAAANIVLFTLASANIGVPNLWIGTFVVYVILSGLQWSKLAGMFDEVLRIQAQVRRLSAVFHQLETYPYGKRAHLKALCSPFLNAREKPSAILRRIGVITSAASLQRNPVVWIMLNLLVPWDVFFAYLLGRSKGNLTQTLPGWLDVWYELEALNALANFAHLNPSYTFPTITPGKIMTGQQLGHPLIPLEERVANDFALNAIGQVVIITGSNMSGKSSFLRTLGINYVLAYAGGVVSADHLEIGLMRVFTSIRVSDSVVDGFSYFYAEVRRLKALLEALRDEDAMPVFFLIDEIFRGTNNRERLIGSRSYIKALVNEHGSGLISTHDLELVKLADDISQIQNYHFREEVINNRMAFDYRLHEGPSPTTNALKIMQIEGLPVDALDYDDAFSNEIANHKVATEEDPVQQD